MGDWVRPRPRLGMNGMPVSLSKQWQEGPHWTWKHGLLLTAVVTSAIFLLGRRRLPGWFLTVLMEIVAWLGLYEAGPAFLTGGIVRFVLHFISPPIGEARRAPSFIP